MKDDDLEYRKSKLLAALMKAIEDGKVNVIPEFDNIRIKAVDSSWEIYGPTSLHGIYEKIRLPVTINGINYVVHVSTNAWTNFCWKALEQPNAKKFVAARKRKVLAQNEVMKRIGLKKEIKAEKQMTSIEILKAQINLENMEILSDEEIKSIYFLEKMIAWQNIHHERDIAWQDFKNNYFYCTRCHSYQEGQCICYAR